MRIGEKKYMVDILGVEPPSENFQILI